MIINIVKRVLRKGGARGFRMGQRLGQSLITKLTVTKLTVTKLMVVGDEQRTVCPTDHRVPLATHNLPSIH